MVLFVASLAVLEAERPNPQANITTFGDALWWAVTTVTTGGYGDHYPITTTGRLVAVGLMLAGITLLGILTASLASCSSTGSAPWSRKPKPRPVTTSGLWRGRSPRSGMSSPKRGGSATRAHLINHLLERRHRPGRPRPATRPKSCAYTKRPFEQPRSALTYTDAVDQAVVCL